MGTYYTPLDVANDRFNRLMRGSTGYDLSWQESEECAREYGDRIGSPAPVYVGTIYGVKTRSRPRTATPKRVRVASSLNSRASEDDSPPARAAPRSAPRSAPPRRAQSAGPSPSRSSRSVVSVLEGGMAPSPMLGKYHSAPKWENPQKSFRLPQRTPGLVPHMGGDVTPATRCQFCQESERAKREQANEADKRRAQSTTAKEAGPLADDAAEFDFFSGSQEDGRLRLKEDWEPYVDNPPERFKSLLHDPYNFNLIGDVPGLPKLQRNCHAKYKGPHWKDGDPRPWKPVGRGPETEVTILGESSMLLSDEGKENLDGTNGREPCTPALRPKRRPEKLVFTTSNGVRVTVKDPALERQWDDVSRDLVEMAERRQQKLRAITDYYRAKDERLKEKTRDFNIKASVGMKWMAKIKTAEDSLRELNEGTRARGRVTSVSKYDLQASSSKGKRSGKKQTTQFKEFNLSGAKARGEGAAGTQAGTATASVIDWVRNKGHGRKGSILS